jgi:hypothetical protein
MINSKNYIGMGYQFHNLVRNSINEMQKGGNLNFILSEQFESEDEGWANYDYITRWNDSKIGVPILFNFYHGLELIMKGMLDRFEVEFATNHSLENLLDKVKTLPNLPVELSSSFERYTYLSDNPFELFFKNNNISPSQYYEALRYPTSRKKVKKYKYSAIRTDEVDGLYNFLTIMDDTNAIIKGIADWFKNNIPKPPHSQSGPLPI